MKKTMILATLLASALMAHAESVKAKIATTITASGKVLPAGEYTISSVPGSSAVLLVTSGTKSVFVFGRFIKPAGEGITKVELVPAKLSTPMLTASAKTE